ncbi:uncharacterized protein LOC110888746 [Helianthus annuus]|uniref:uncharacterized protein LOC110888746 n=1 Tax=Helianthus annuus TaxID=4232 RepID=UPI000B8EED88|nr:uncharacterized protein LOC110888746 [Helianthus annuus]
MDMLRAMQQDMQKRNQLDEVRMQKDEVRDKSIQSLTTQMGQLATDVSELKKRKGQLPSDTKAKSPGVVEGVVEDITGNESDDEVSPVKPKESNVNKPGLGENEKSEKVEGERSQVPFPSALLDPGRKNFIASRGPQKEELWDMFKQVKINLPLLDAMKQVPAYAKFLKELCTPKRQQKKKMPKRVDLTGQALLDLGAGVSILPGGLYDQYDFGPLARVETTVVLADLSHKLPRGMVQNVIVKIDEFYYPVDFLVLDYSSADPKQQQNVILGRPFLSTAHAVIDCRFGTVDITFGNRKMRLNVFTNNANDVGVDECFMVHAYALRVEEEKQDAMALREGRPPWTHQFEGLPAEIDSGTKPSLEEPPKLELKDLSSHLKYAFLGDNDTLPVIIASNLELVQEQALLKEHLVKAPILQPPDWSKPFEIMCDASDTTIGSILGQRVDKKPVCSPIFDGEKGHKASFDSMGFIAIRIQFRDPRQKEK